MALIRSRFGSPGAALRRLGNGATYSTKLVVQERHPQLQAVRHAEDVGVAQERMSEVEGELERETWSIGPRPPAPPDRGSSPKSEAASGRLARARGRRAGTRPRTFIAARASPGRGRGHRPGSWPAFARDPARPVRRSGRPTNARSGPGPQSQSETRGIKAEARVPAEQLVPAEAADRHREARPLANCTNNRIELHRLRLIHRAEGLGDIGPGCRWPRPRRWWAGQDTSRPVAGDRALVESGSAKSMLMVRMARWFIRRPRAAMAPESIPPDKTGSRAARRSGAG